MLVENHRVIYTNANAHNIIITLILSEGMLA